MFYVIDKVRRNVLVSSDQGLLVVNRFDYDENAVGIGQFILDHGNTSTVEANHCIKKIKDIPNPVIFDIGANIGTFTIWLANYFTEGKIFSFEPQRIVYQMLCGNLAINNIFNVYAYNMALGNSNEKIVFEEPNYQIPTNFGKFSLKTDNIKEKSDKYIVNQLTLDSFVNEYKVERVDLIKTDTEGMDLDVLRGSKDTIIKFSPIIFVEYQDTRNNYFNDIVKFFDSINYTYYIIHNNLLGYKIER